MNKTKKIILQLLVVFVFAGGVYALYTWNKPARDVTEETGIEVTASAIFDAYTSNENDANTKYLNKAVEVTGTVADAKKNQSGQIVVILQSSDPVFGVNCTFKEDPGAIEKGSTITFKGVCTGFLSDVIINQGVLIKK